MVVISRNYTAFLSKSEGRSEEQKNHAKMANGRLGAKETKARDIIDE
jgi:hypothetical protein